MIPTLKTSNGTAPALGGLQVQPVLNNLVSQVSKQSTQQSHLQTSVVTASDALVHVAATIKETGKSSVLQTSSLSQLAKSVSLGTKITIPISNVISHVSPSYVSALTITQQTERTLIDNLNVSSKKFVPYEDLTGVSQDRPEIVLVTAFQPSFDGSAMTDVGRFIDAQVQMRNLAFSNVSHLLASAKASNQVVARTMTAQRQSFNTGLTALRDTVGFLSELVKTVDETKSRFDLRNDAYVTDPVVTVKRYVSTATRTGANVSTSAGSVDLVSRLLPPSYSVADVMVRFGYDADIVKGTFASTKVWLQLMVELRNAVRDHSWEFLDVDPVQQSIDKSPSVILNTNSNRFALSAQSPGLVAVSKLSKLQPNDITQIVSALSQVYASVYSSTTFKSDEAKIAALAHLVSKEYRFSSGLKRADVMSTLSTYYGYTVSAKGDNVAVFDAVFGRVGNNISDIPSSVTNDLASLSQRQPSENVAVLTFERKYLDGDTGTLTPGSAFFVDHMLQTTNGQTFDTSNLSSLASTFELAQKQFNTIVNGMSVLMVHEADSRDTSSSTYSSMLTNPHDFLQAILSQVLNTSGTPLSIIADDRLTSIYALASSNATLRSLLFLLTVSRAMRTYTNNMQNAVSQDDNTALTDEIVTRVLEIVQSSLKPSASSVGNERLRATTTETLTSDSIKTALKQGTPMTSLIEGVMSKVLATFKALSTVDDRTLYTGCLDTSVLMMAFDLVMSLLAKYGNQTLTGIKYGQTSVTKTVAGYVVSKQTLNYKTSVANALNRLDRESAFIHQGILSVMNVLQNTAQSSRALVSYLTKQNTLVNLQRVSVGVGDPSLLHLLLTEQQVASLLTMTNDIAAIASKDHDVDLIALDGSTVEASQLKAMHGVLQLAENSTSSANGKRIMTVGIPSGFAQALKQRASLTSLTRSSFVNKQEDIVKVVVHKVDLQNGDLIFRPQEHLFELSRYPVRDASAIQSISNKPSMIDVVGAVPTWNVDQGTCSLEYFSTSNVPQTKQASVAFTEPSYSFLSSLQKFQILRNHVVSYVLETYLKLMTSIDVADSRFDLIDPPRSVGQDFVKLVLDVHVDGIMNKATSTKGINSAALLGNLKPNPTPTGGTLFRTTAVSVGTSNNRTLNNTAGVSGNINSARQLLSIRDLSPTSQSQQQQANVRSASSSLTQASPRQVPQLMTALSTVNTLSRMVSTQSDVDLVTQRLLKPKQFDRVFNVLIDPDAFEIDYDKTTSTPQGTQALKQLISRGDVVVITPSEQSSISGDEAHYGIDVRNLQPTVNRYMLRKRNVTQGDVLFDKYFVTIQTLDEEQV